LYELYINIIFFNNNKIESDKNYLTSRDKLIFALFMLLPAIDYLRMFIINKEPLTEDKILIHKRNNYYYNSSGRLRYIN